MSSIIESLQQEIADYLSAQPEFANVPVLVEHLKDYQTEYDRALGPLNTVGGKTGVCITLITPTANANWNNVPGPFFDDIPITLLIQENREVNLGDSGTEISALNLCELCCNFLAQPFFPASANGPLRPDSPTILRGEDTEFIIYNVKFKTMGGIRSALPQLPTPTNGLSGGLTTLACATAGAAIFFTQDGTNPAPRNGTLYTAPFIPTGTIKARAWLAGYLASATLTL